jgi:hypothetical protein
MKRIALTLLAVSAMACVSLPRPVSVANRPTDALLLEGEWSGEFSSDDGVRSGSIAFGLQVRDDTARGPGILRPVIHVAAQAGASVPTRAEAGTAIRSSMYFVSVTDGVVAGVMPTFFDVDRLAVVQMTFVGRLRSWNIIEGTYVTLGTNLRVQERGSWRVLRRN